MAFNMKWLGGFAAAALMLTTAPPASADDTGSDQSESAPSESNPEVVIPSEPGEPGTVVVPEESTPEEQPQVQEEAVPKSREGTIIVEPRRTAPLDNVLVEIGGGASTYTGTLGDVLEGGAGWTGRAVIGARTMVGFEIAYFGAANTIEQTNTNISDLGDLSTDNTVISSAGEGLARFNFLGARAAVKPFVAGGVNYTRFDSNLLFDNREALGFPLAAGIQFYPLSNFTIGARADYRILTDWIDNDVPDGDQWGGTLTVGANF